MTQKPEGDQRDACGKVRHQREICETVREYSATGHVLPIFKFPASCLLFDFDWVPMH